MVIQTIYFDIIYPPESAQSAQLLASHADAFADEICSFLNTHMKERIPVYLDPRSKKLNAYYTGFPYSRIYLYDTVPLEGSLAVFSDTLLSVFYHELAHAVSLTIRTPFWQVLSQIFGDIVSVNQFLTMPLSFIEGLAVSFESLGGEGRVNDLAMKEFLIQAKMNDKLKSWKEAAGARDLYPGAKSSYIFGGFFSHWLQTKYGMENYARLWQRGSGLHILKNGIQSQFKAVYGISIENEWKLFYESIPIPLDISPLPPSITGTTTGIFTALTSGKTGLAWFDSNENAVFFQDLQGKSHRLFRAVNGVHRLSFSPNGTELLISGFSVLGKTTYPELRIYNFEKRKFTGEKWSGYRDAAFASSSQEILAIQTKSQESQLHLISRTGTSKARQLYSTEAADSFPLIFNPVAFGEDKIIVIGAQGLERSLIYIDLSTSKTDLERTQIWNTTHILPSLRTISVSKKNKVPQVFMSYSGPQGLTRWASIEPFSGTITTQSRDYLGVLSYPVYQESTDSIVYIADCTDHQKIVAVSATESIEIAHEFISTATATSLPQSFHPSVPYNGLKWFSDGFFFPSVKIDFPEKNSDAFVWSFLYTTQDPTETVFLTLEPSIHLDPLFLDWTVSTVFNANNWNLSLTGSDQLMPSISLYTPYRKLTFGSTIQTALYSWNSSNVFSITAGFLYNTYSNNIFTQTEPYKAPFSTSSTVYSTELGYSALTTTNLSQFPLFRVTGKGLSATFLSDIVSTFPQKESSAVLQTALLFRLPFAPLSLEFSAARGFGISFTPASASVSVLSAQAYDTGIKRLIPIFSEYNKTTYSNYNSSLVAACIAELDLLTLDIQKGIPLLPAYANRFIVTGGYKGAVFGYPETSPIWLDSAYASVSFQGAFLVGMLSTIVLEGKAGYLIPLRSGKESPFFSLRIGAGL